MSVVDYEHECSRAELLGQPRPTWDEFLARKRQEEEENEGENVNEKEEVKPEEMEELDYQREGLNRVTGGLDELNNILSITQKKINRFKTVCGSFSNLLKLRVSTRPGDESGETSSQHSINIDQSNNSENQDGVSNVNEDSTEPIPVAEQKKVTPKTSSKTDFDGQVGSQLDKLDSLIMKSERAELSLSSQSKQIKNILK